MESAQSMPWNVLHYSIRLKEYYRPFFGIQRGLEKRKTYNYLYQY